MNKKIDITTPEGLKSLRLKAKDYGHYAEFLHVIELIDEIESLKEQRDAYQKAAEEWMADYDKLKDKYEPSILVES